MIKKMTQLEVGLYKDAKRDNMTFSQKLEELVRKEEISPDLVSPDARNSRGERVDAFKQLLAAAGIRTKGEFAQTGDAFLADQNNRVLFPEFINRTYRDAETDQINALQITDLVADRIGIDSNAYKTGVIAGGQEKDLEFGRVAQGGELPVYTVTVADNAVSLFKFGGILKVSYEAARRMPLTQMARYIAKIARAQSRRKVKQATAVALNGDGNSNAAPASAAIAGTVWTLADLIQLEIDGMQNGAGFNILTGDGVEIAQILALDIFTGPAATAQGAAFRDTGEWPTILGMRPRVSLSGSALEGSKKIMAIETAAGLEEVYENGAELTETDKLIDTQFERVAISEVLGYAKPDVQAFRTKLHG